MSERKMINLYGSGGFGINTVSKFENKSDNKEDIGFPDLSCFYMDTSKSNLKFNPKEESLFLIDNVDGSGKKRDQNYQVISERSKEMLLKFKPSDLNIVVHSASGGSGSVIGPVIVSELLSRNAPTIVIMVGTKDSRIEIDNTIKTLKSYEAIAQKRGIPVIAAYYENDKNTGRAITDNKVQTLIVLLAAIFSGQNSEMDSSDLNNWLNYPKVTSSPARLALLNLFSGNIEPEKDEVIVSVATLTDHKNSASLDIDVEYQTVGFINDIVIPKLNLDMPIHATTNLGAFNKIINTLTTRLSDIDNTRSATIDKHILSENDNVSHDGLIF